MDELVGQQALHCPSGSLAVHLKYKKNLPDAGVYGRRPYPFGAVFPVPFAFLVSSPAFAGFCCFACLFFGCHLAFELSSCSVGHPSSVELKLKFALLGGFFVSVLFFQSCLPTI